MITTFVPPPNKPFQDLVMTPEPCAIDIISHFMPTGKILDPCRGTGSFYNNFPIQVSNITDIDIDQEDIYIIK